MMYAQFYHFSLLLLSFFTLAYHCDHHVSFPFYCIVLWWIKNKDTSIRQQFTRLFLFFLAAIEGREHPSRSFCALDTLTKNSEEKLTFHYRLEDVVWSVHHLLQLHFDQSSRLPLYIDQFFFSPSLSLSLSYRVQFNNDWLSLSRQRLACRSLLLLQLLRQCHRSQHHCGWQRDEQTEQWKCLSLDNQ